MAEPYTYLDKVAYIGEHQLSNQLEYNLKAYVDYMLLGMGGWQNIERPTSGAYGGDFSILRLVNDPSYTEGTVWETARKDWVYETGVVSYPTSAPISISGIYINGTLYQTGDATYGHHYNYPLGRVVFDSPVSISSVVTLNYSFRDVQVYLADNAPWWDEIQYDSYRVDDDTYSVSNSGAWAVLSNHRVQLPAIVIEILPNRNMKPYQLGDTSQILKQSVAFHILAESRWWRNQLMDIVSLHKDNQIWLLDYNTMANSGSYPLDYRGMKINNNTYDSLVNTSQYRYALCRVADTDIQESLSPNPRLYTAMVRGDFEIVIT